MYLATCLLIASLCNSPEKYLSAPDSKRRENYTSDIRKIHIYMRGKKKYLAREVQTRMREIFKNGMYYL